MSQAADARERRTRRLLEGPIAPTILTLAASNLPFVIGQTGAQVVEAWYIGRLGVTALASVALVAHSGAEALAGYGLGARLELMMAPLVFGIGTALTAMVGVNVVAGQWERARRAALTGGLMAGALTGAVGVTVAFWPGLWLDLFTDDAAAKAAGALYLRHAGPVYCLLGFGLAVYFASLGARQTVWPTVAVAMRLMAILAAAALVAADDLRAVFLAIAGAIFLFGALNAWGLTRPGWKGRKA